MPRVLIPLAQGCEELEAVTIIDLLRRAEIEVITASLDVSPVTASRGTVLLADAQLEVVKNDNFEMIVLPGGLPGADNLNNNETVHKLLQQFNADKRWIAAICAAPKVLASAGLLNNKKITSFPGALEDYDIPGLVYSTDPVVIDENIITSRGPGTAMDFALSLIVLLLGEDAKKAVEKPLQRP